MTKNKLVKPMGKLSIVVILVIASYLFGKQSSSVNLANPTSTPNQPIKDTTQSLIARCGDIPLYVGNSPTYFSRVYGLSWSPDCRHIAWYVTQPAVGLPGTSELPPDEPWEGSYIYYDAAKNTTKIKIKGYGDKDIRFMEWKDKDRIILLLGPDKHVTYNINNGSIENE